MNLERIIAGVIIGMGAIALIFKDEVEIAAVLLATLMAFFVGETNGKRKERKDSEGREDED